MKYEPKIFRVSEINRLIKAMLEDEIGEAWVEGEISNLRRPASGHLYFTLKDDSAQISAVMFKGSQFTLPFKPEDGMLVNAYGQITVYERGGQYQLIVRKMIESGQGALQAKFEALKRKLTAEGLFDPERKKKLPLLPTRIGVITSHTGAAVRDIINVLSRRFNNLNILIGSVKVQGEGAAEEIAQMIRLMNQRPDIDVLIVGRGGGSIEDLWAFNEECVARAIADSGIPVISAVGHETDFTICDFVADVRAPT
ncbi:MAG: exodeoxyribonuclease VII large subunit, partial [Lentisphaerae bacterium]|nr:exodeoxyribonuclease VII large subunit [Lentisphaerota bacterium]